MRLEARLTATQMALLGHAFERAGTGSAGQWLSVMKAMAAPVGDAASH